MQKRSCAEKSFACGRALAFCFDLAAVSRETRDGAAELFKGFNFDAGKGAAESVTKDDERPGSLSSSAIETACTPTDCFCKLTR